MKNYLIALVLLFGVGCAETPDDYVSEDLDVITEATQAWILPNAVYVRGRLVNTSPITWLVSREYFGRLWFDTATKRGYYIFGNNGVGASSSATSSAASCTKSGTNFVCGGVSFGCPTIDYGRDPDSNYFAAGNGVYAEGWYPASYNQWHVYSGSNTMTATSAGLAGSAYNWSLTCAYPKPSEYYILQG